MSGFREYLNEAKIKKFKTPHEFSGSNLSLVGKGMDTNGNFVVKVSYPNSSAFSIQTAQNLPVSDKELRGVDKLENIDAKKLQAMGSEIAGYIEKYGSKKQKAGLKTY